MTALSVVLQERHRCLHVLTDGAIYTNDGTVVGKGSKTFTVPSWPGVVSTRGPALATAIIGQGLSFYLHSFDDAVARIEQILPEFIGNCAPLYEGMGLQTIQVVIAGWSAARDRPESYLIDTAGDGALVPLPKVASAPLLDTSSAICRSAHYVGIAPDQSPVQVIADMRLMIECQRRTKEQYLGNALHTVGCFGQLTTVTPEGIEQRILVRWDEDAIGEKLTPDLSVPLGGTVIPEGLSRLQRERMEKKLRKGTLRAV